MREAHAVHKRSQEARKLLGAKGKRFAKKRYTEKAQMKKTLKMHDESTSRQKVDDDVQEGALPPYLLDRDQTQHAKEDWVLALDTSEKMSIRTVLSSMSSNSTSKLELPQNWS